MTEPITHAIALLVLFFSAQTGAKSGAFAALYWMLASVFALLCSLHYWFLVTRAAASYETVSLPVLATCCFWLLFVVFLFALVKARESYIFEYEAITASSPGRLLGGLFGTVTGTVFVAALFMTASLVAPDYFPKGQPTLLPIPPDAMPSTAFRYLETHLLGVTENDPVHTPLPKTRNAELNPVAFWQ